MSSLKTLAAGITAMVIGFCLATAQESPSHASNDTDQSVAKERLSQLSALVGEWRGIGQPKRGSSRGAWSEKSAWVWDFKTEPALVGTVEKGKLAKSARLTWDAKPGEYVLTLTAPDQSKHEYRGTLADDTLTLTTATETEKQQITVRFPNDKRSVILFEEQRGSATVFSRVAEVGYTRKGESIAVAGGGPECIVTGGKGTMRVTFNGNTYYVCCTGCEQAFNDDPAGVIKEYQRKLAALKSAK